MSALEYLHLSAPVAAALERLGWSDADPMVREAAPTVARGHNLVVVTPPSPAYAAPALAGLISRLSEGGRAMLLCPAGQLDVWATEVHLLGRGSAVRVQVAHGTARAMRRLRGEAIDLLVATPETALALQRRSALGLDRLNTVLLAWPENYEEGESIAPLMQDLPKEAQRIIHTAAPESVAELVERYARRALTLGAPPPGTVAEPVGPVRTVSVPWDRRAAALADLVELLDPPSLVVWSLDRGQHEAIEQALSLQEPEIRLVTGDAPKAQTIVAFDLPTPERLRQLLSAGEVVLLLPPGTETFAARIAAPRRPLRLPSAVDTVTTAGAAQRAAVVRGVESGRPERALLTLAPLFERYDPSLVAAALFELWITAGVAVPSALPDIPATSKIYVGVGKKDGATANDLVAVLTKEVRLDRTKIGRVELREAYSLVEVPAQEAERVASALNGVTIRRKRISARVDRGAARPERTDRKPGTRNQR
ncbi:MAG: DbpA RNA binding domain-containing protein [Gemmatimonadales bacterium]